MSVYLDYAHPLADMKIKIWGSKDGGVAKELQDAVVELKGSIVIDTRKLPKDLFIIEVVKE